MNYSQASFRETIWRTILKALEDNGIKATPATAPLNGEYDRAKAMDKFMPILGSAPFDCIISNNDAMALGAIEAMEQKGMDPKEIPIVGIDATPNGRAAIKLDKIKMSSFQNG